MVQVILTLDLGYTLPFMLVTNIKLEIDCGKISSISLDLIAEIGLLGGTSMKS